ncbi:MAG: glycosyltransferase family 4 protein [Gammaproteobacteria bacterium]|jgi:glycosyltransferase involved in cell wall biosynthesis|nr:glycosyltransferase family 4 protein [Gammaproteobacteria bacterium]
MRILFFTDNFPPESNAPAIRTFEHAREWVKAGHEVTVVTCVPNFPTGKVFPGYSNRLYQTEEQAGIEVVRVWSYVTANQGSVPRVLDYFSYMLSATSAALFLPRPDVVIGTSPQLFAAIGAWLTARVKRVPFVFELRDLWPESILAVGAMRGGFWLTRLERFVAYLYRQADLMVPVTQAFARVLRNEGVDEERIVVITNGIEPGSHTLTRTREDVRNQWGIPGDAFVGGFIGTLGMAHAVATILESAELTRGDPSIHFVIMGNGAERDQIKQLAAKKQLDNVTIVDGQPRQEALNVLGAVDASLVLLRNTPLFRTVIPSKIFEAMEFGKPIILGVRGESADIVVAQSRSGVAITPESPAELSAQMQRLRDAPELCAELGSNGKAAVASTFRRTQLAARMLAAIETTVSGAVAAGREGANPPA